MSERTRARLLAAAPYLVFAALAALTWKRWIFPFQDHGREMNLPLRLLHGELLYRDAASSYGPLPPYLDALALRLFGWSLDVLVAVRIAVALAGIAALLRLARRLAGEAAASALVSFAVACCFFGYGCAWPFPYSVAALEGTVGTWWALELGLSAAGPGGALLAALIGGLAAGTKLEFLPAAAGAVLLGVAARRPRREALAAGAGALLLGAAAWGTPVLLFGREALTRHGFLVALDEPRVWRELHAMVFFGGMSPGAFLAGGYLLALLPSLALLGAALLLLPLLARREPRLAPAAALLLGALGAVVPRNEELSALLLLALGLGVLGTLRAARALLSGAPVPAEAAFAFPMLLALARQPFFLRIPVYSAFAGPLALVGALAWVSRRRGLPAPLAALLAAGLAAGQLVDRARERAAIPMERVALPHATLALPAESAPVVAGTAAAIERLTPPGAWVAGFPEPGLLLFATGRRTPFVDEQFFPGCQTVGGEDEMIQRLAERPLALAFQTNHPMGAFGAGEYRQGLLDRFFRAFDARMRPAFVLGDPGARIRHLGTATGVIVYVPRRGP